MRLRMFLAMARKFFGNGTPIADGKSDSLSICCCTQFIK